MNSISKGKRINEWINAWSISFLILQESESALNVEVPNYWQDISPHRESKEGTWILERKWGQRWKCVGSYLTHTGKVGVDGAVTERRWVLCSRLDSEPLEIPGASPNCVLHILFLLTFHLQIQSSQEALGAIPPNKRHWDGSLSSASERLLMQPSWLPSIWMEDPADQTACPAAAPCCWVASGE